MSALRCAVCNKLSTPDGTKHKKCGVCKSTNYCSTICQKEDWHTHKLICDQYQPFLTSTPRPSPAHRLAILFPSEKAKPKFVWVACQRRDGFDHLYCGVLLDREDHHTEGVHVTTHLQYQFPDSERFSFRHAMKIYIGDMCERDGSPENLSIRTMMKGTNKHLWKGPILAVSQPPPPLGVRLPEFYQDISCADLRILSDFFRTYGDGSLIHAVMIASKVDQRIHEKPEFYKVDLPRDSGDFNALRPTSITKAMGIPLIVQKCGNIMDPSEYDRLGYNPNENRSAVFLNIIVEPQNPKFGFTDLSKWDTEVGNVTVVRKDKKDISPEQVEGIAYFIRQVVAPGMGLEDLEENFEGGDDYSDENIEKARDKVAKSLLTRETFEDFFKKYRDKKIATGHGAWEHAVSPYET